MINGAITQVLSALPEGARLREVKPDLVSLADVAARLSVSRQALQKRDMPPPSLGGLYRASEILPALTEEAKRAILRDTLRRGRQPNLSFFAFTATPKFKTKAMFDEPGPDGHARNP